MIDTRIKRDISLYQYLQERDVIGKLRPFLEQNNFQISADGRWRRATSTLWETPWIHQHNVEKFECELWHKLFFQYFKQVPTYCQNCWKVVVMPRTVVELFRLYELQTDLEHNCKCGIELRATDDRRYGGYFYNWGHDAGQACFEKVRKGVNRYISRKVPVILKCACTEYEIECGPPAEWVADEKQLFVEDCIRKYVVATDWHYHQHDYIKVYVMLKWIHHAAATGDFTYKELTDGKDITFKAKTYHKE